MRTLENNVIIQVDSDLSRLPLAVVYPRFIPILGRTPRLAVYATEKSAEMPRQPYKQRRDRFREGSTCLRRSCAGFVFVYRRRALLIPAYMTGGLVSRWNEEQATGIKALARRSIQVNCSVQEKRVDRAELAGSGALRDNRSTAS
jgi:hypothetical protein